MTNSIQCHYCTKPPHEDHLLCAFHLDWEAACNVAEDEGNGRIYGPRVDELMIEWGWSAGDVARERDEQMIDRMAEVVVRSINNETNVSQTRRAVAKKVAERYGFKVTDI